MPAPATTQSLQQRIVELEAERDALQSTTDALTDANTALQRKVRTLQQLHRRGNAKKARQAASIADLEGELKFTRIKSGVRFASDHAALTAIAQRAAANVPAYSLGFAMGIDISGTTITSWETKLRSARIASMHSFIRAGYSDSLDELTYRHLSGESDVGWSFVVHNLRGDATNTRVLTLTSRPPSDASRWRVLDFSFTMICIM